MDRLRSMNGLEYLAVVCRDFLTSEYTCMVLRRSLDTQGGSREHFSKPQSELNLEDFRRGAPSGFQSQHISENCIILHASSSYS